MTNVLEAEISVRMVFLSLLDQMLFLDDYCCISHCNSRASKLIVCEY